MATVDARITMSTPVGVFLSYLWRAQLRGTEVVPSPNDLGCIPLQGACPWLLLVLSTWPHFKGKTTAGIHFRSEAWLASRPTQH